MINIISHPVVNKDVSVLRNKETTSYLFRQAVARISYFLCFEVLKNVKTDAINIQTPLENCIGYQISSDIIFIPILRAGISMLEPFLSVYPEAKIGYYGVKRNEETLQPEEYYYSMPSTTDNSEVYILDPMIATGGSVLSLITRLQLDGIEKINVISLISAPEGIENIMAQFPEVRITTACLDTGLNEHGYILPGLGDAGDRVNNC